MHARFSLADVIAELKFNFLTAAQTEFPVSDLKVRPLKVRFQ